MRLTEIWAKEDLAAVGLKARTKALVRHARAVDEAGLHDEALGEAEGESAGRGLAQSALPRG